FSCSLLVADVTGARFNPAFLSSGSGAVTFKVLQNGNLIGTATPTSTFDSQGNASVSYALPAGLAADSYTIEADYSDSAGNFVASSDTTHTLTVNKATPTVSVTDAGGTYIGKPFPAKATAVGVDGTTPVDGSFTFTYYAGTGTSGTNLGL